MRNAKDIERAIESLPKAELKEFRAWFAQYDAEIWDAKIEEHALSGKLAHLGKDALRAHRNKDTKEI
jgi:hypothetical protein